MIFQDEPMYRILGSLLFMSKQKTRFSIFPPTIIFYLYFTEIKFPGVTNLFNYYDLQLFFFPEILEKLSGYENANSLHRFWTTQAFVKQIKTFLPTILKSPTQNHTLRKEEQAEMEVNLEYFI